MAWAENLGLKPRLDPSVASGHHVPTLPLSLGARPSSSQVVSVCARVIPRVTKDLPFISAMGPKQRKRLGEPQPPKRARKVLTLDEKIKILDLLDTGKSNVEVGRMFGKNESSIRTIKSQAVAIRSSVRVSPQTSKTVQMVRDSVLIKTEQALNLWVEDMIRKHVPLDGNIMREKAKSLYGHYIEDVPQEERKEFKASKGWLYSFVQRFNLKNLKVTGESASADKEAADAFLPHLKDIIEEKGYRPEQVFNCDETGLFWKKMPNRTYIHQSAKQAPGFKAWKDRLTLVLCANAAGHVIKPGLIYRAKNPRALKNKNKNCLPVFWQHNKKAWMTATLFLEWMHQCFIPETKKYLEEKGIPFKVLLLIDNAPGHPEACTTCDDNVEVIFLPKNTTSLIQPLDQGVIKCIKAAYTKKTMTKIRDAIDLDPEMGVVEQWKKFTIADAITLISDSVEACQPETINACWQNLWPESVNHFTGFPTIEAEIRNILTVAREVGGEGMEDLLPDEIEEHIAEHGQTLTNEELEDLTRASSDEEDDIHREEDEEEEEPAAWSLEKFSDVFFKAQALQDAIMESDPSMDRALRVTRGITAALQPIQVLFSEAKKRRRQLPITMFLRRSPPPTRSTLDAPVPSTSSAYASPPRVSSPSSTDSAATEKRPASPPSPPADLSPPRKLLRTRAYRRRPLPIELVEVQASSSDPDDPPGMGQEGEEYDPLAHVAEGPI